MEGAAHVVPWFLKNMPAAYFNQTPEESRKQHLKAIQAIRDLEQSDLSLKIESKGKDGSTDITYINSQTKSGLLHSQIKGLVAPANSTLSRVKVFSSLDGGLALNVFSFESANRLSSTASKDDTSRIFAMIDEIKAGKHATDASVPAYSDLFSAASMGDYVGRVSPVYARTSDPRRFLIQRELFEKVRGTESSSVHVESVGENSWVTIAASNVLPEVLLRLSSNIISARGLDILRAHLDTVQDPANAIPEIPNSGSVTMLRLLVNPRLDKHSTQFVAQADFLNVFQKDLQRAKWLDDETTDLGLSRYPSLGIGKAEIITALCSMLHGPLSKQNPSTYSSIHSIIRILDSSPHFIQSADNIAQLFLDRFNPNVRDAAGKPVGLGDEEFHRRAQDIQNKVSRLHHEPARVLLLKMLDTVKLTLRTNYYNEDRYALSMRVHPSVMIPVDSGKAMPFGVLFSHGRHFNGFHNRFRDIARGGLRVVTPPNADQYVLESARQYDEVYGLSFAQQQKNKDIPEGGSKAVVLLNAPKIPANDRFFAARKSIKAFTDSILDLIVKDSLAGIVDHYGKDELIYLGPDEQVIPSDIDWITTRAAQRGYPIPAAFMSSKKDAGINHKVYGVTSEGVAVYLDIALRSVLGIDPNNQPFTVKITGGPDGDVAGNLMKILFRDYGDNAKVVGIADGFGVAEDPNGLDSAELSRLVEASLPITSFDAKKLSPQGVLFGIDTEEGLQRRLSMPFRVKADAFVPAGGRPNTINGDNWRQFLDANGKPSSPLIVEGANIFNTPEARENLFKHAGVVIVKDSSANKCGVITSSCEVAASMLLSKDEFMAVKNELVSDVIVRLRVLAKLEAELLFRSYRNYPGNMPHFSERISNAINTATDAIADALADVQPSDPLFQELLPLIKDNMPKKLADVAWDRAAARFPVQYQRNAIACHLASQLVYSEGIHVVETQPGDKLAERAFLYYREHKAIKALADDFDKATVGVPKEQKAKVLDLLRRGGARTSLGIF